MRKFLCINFLLVCMVWATGVAQDRKITGKVTSAEDGSPLPGVSVVVKGTSKGTNTDAAGSYSIDAPVNATLVFSFVGTLTQEIAIGSRTTVNLALAADTKQLSEVVVTAQGIVREKRALGYSVASVDAKNIQDRPQADVGRVLQGKIAGVNVTATSGVSGTGTNITIRGYSSITGSVQPLFVVDGVPFNSNTNTRGGFTQGNQSSSSRFLDIDPNNIENVTVLKGLAATVTYGDQGRNGVILITTKNGSKKVRKTEFNVTQSFFTNTAHLPRYQNDYVGGFQQNLGYFFSNWGPTLDEARTYPSQNTNTALNTHPYAFLSNAALRNSMADYVASVSPYKMEVFPNNVKDFFRTGQISNTSLNISGGGEKVSYNMSAGYNKEGGYIPNNDLTRLNLGLGLNAQMSKRLTATVSFNYANTVQSSPPLSSGTGNNANDFPSILANVMYTPRQVDLMGWPYTSPLDGSSVYFRSGNDIPNPRWMLDNYKTTGAVNRIFTTSTFNYELGKDLMLLFKTGLDTYDEQQEFLINKGGVALVTGLYNTLNIKNTIVDNSLILSYTKSLSDKLSLSGKLGGNIRNDRFRLDNINSQNQLARSLFRHSNFIDNVASNSTEEQTRMGIFGELTADYGNFLFANLAARNDWTSTVEKDNRRILYPSFSVSFVPTTAFKGLESSFLSFLKIRAGVGSSAGFPNPYSTRNFLNQNARAFLNSAGNTVQTHSVDNTLGNPNLRPELHTEYEFGVEGKLFRSRIGFDLTFYRRDTRDLITRAPLDASTGYTGTTINIGKIRNEGIEISLNGNVIKSKDFSWDITGTFSRNRPKVLDLGGTLQEVQISGFNGLGNFAVVGQPFNIIKGTGYRRNEQGQFLIDGGGYLQTTATPIILGDPNPAFNTSLINDFGYKGISLSFMFSYRHGGAMYSSTAGALLGRGLTYDTGLANGYDRAQTFIFPGVKADGTPNDIQVTASDVGFNNIYFFGDEGRIFDGSTIRLQEVSLGYQLPKKLFTKLPIKGASFQFTGNNLWYKALNFPPGLNFDTDNLGLGVGNGLGFEFLTGPSARRLGVTLKLTF
ncbi:SusC/RagA family TonB-linked outer membrane protein [Runella slithyformis]|uniref:TonB-dependent receptor plug n=1 Tax=Runella slithyformis (strain ATCC 29530 / DSM 19594 / LMG 11500 / NCIMB 11436 / LSU 4) TaxID=761193 RepID=A0A7U3ZIA2_RUNSL|nr:SusC/RagA family TonB-linked outer membrane protein [Runella slithyformis]AEI47693.1 TonB-dependent receptor plug [Runella slithyformis DSM 19594]